MYNPLRDIANMHEWQLAIFWAKTFLHSSVWIGTHVCMYSVPSGLCVHTHHYLSYYDFCHPQSNQLDRLCFVFICSHSRIFGLFSVMQQLCRCGILRSTFSLIHSGTVPIRIFKQIPCTAEPWNLFCNDAHTYHSRCIRWQQVLFPWYGCPLRHKRMHYVLLFWKCPLYLISISIKDIFISISHPL
jgi:hypothetical protein